MICWVFDFLFLGVSVSSLCLCGESLLQTISPRRHRGFTETQNAPQVIIGTANTHVTSKAPSPLRFAGALQIFLFIAFAFFSARAQSITELERGFEHPPGDAKIMMRWWWFGPAVTKPELEREMRLMKEGGIGGFEVQPVYPLVLDDEAAGIKTQPFLSREFLESLRFTAEK